MSKNKNTNSTENQHPNRIGFKEGLGYAFGDAGNLFILTYVSSYLKVFYTDVLKVAESKITTLLLISRLWDAINDPMWGSIVAKRKPAKDGKLYVSGLFDFYSLRILGLEMMMNLECGRQK